MMKCPSIGILQSLLDGELDIGQRKQMEQHLQQCDTCQNNFDRLKENDNLVFSKVQNYKLLMESENAELCTGISTRNVMHIEKIPSSGNIDKPKRRNITKGWNVMLNWVKKNHKLVTAACLAIVMLVCVSVQPIRAAISDALTIFRVEKIKGITFTMEDIRQMQDQINQKSPNISLDQLGNMKMTGGETKQNSLQEAASPTDFRLMIPKSLVGSEPAVTQVNPARVEFILKVDAVNELMKSFGATRLLPASIDGKTVAVEMARQVAMVWQTNQGPLYLTETAKPSLEVPSEVDVNQIHDALVELPILPDNLKNQLKSVTDWKSTLYMPVVGEISEEITINGQTAWFYSNVTTDGKDPDTSVHSSLVMIVDNTICVFGSNMGKMELIALAKSLVPVQ